MAIANLVFAVDIGATTEAPIRLEPQSYIQNIAFGYAGVGSFLDACQALYVECFWATLPLQTVDLFLRGVVCILQRGDFISEIVYGCLVFINIFLGERPHASAAFCEINYGTTG